MGGEGVQQEHQQEQHQHRQHQHQQQQQQQHQHQHQHLHQQYQQQHLLDGQRANARHDFLLLLPLPRLVRVHQRVERRDRAVGQHEGGAVLPHDEPHAAVVQLDARRDAYGVPMPVPVPVRVRVLVVVVVRPRARAREELAALVAHERRVRIQQRAELRLRVGGLERVRAQRARAQLEEAPTS